MARITKDDFRPDKPKRRRRKPMTEEQKAAATERLAKAREARLKKIPTKLKIKLTNPTRPKKSVK